MKLWRTVQRFLKRGRMSDAELHRLVTHLLGTTLALQTALSDLGINVSMRSAARSLYTLRLWPCPLCHRWAHIGRKAGMCVACSFEKRLAHSGEED